MTFLLFLASLAALEYILSRSPSRPRRDRYEQPPDSPATADLHALAQAVEEHGRGKPVGHSEEKLVK